MKATRVCGKSAADSNLIMATNYRIESSILYVFRWSVQCFHSLNVWMKCMIGKLMDSKQGQPRGITHEDCEKTYVSGETSTGKELESEDKVDFTFNEPVLQALEGVSEAIYKICFSKWHCPPEEIKEQPLFKEIDAGIRGIYYNIKDKVRPLEEYEILIAIANALISHLKNFRKKRVTNRYYTSQEEADFLRKQTKYLLLYWLPDSLRNSNHILVFLNEILSINVLGPSINILADPPFINEIIVKALAGEEVLEKDGFKLGSALSDCCAIRADGGDINMFESDGITNRKKKKKGILRKIKSMVNRSRSKEHEKHEYSKFRSFSESREEDTMDCTDGFTYTGFCDESGDGDPVSTVNDTVLQKWLQEHWTATICENLTKDRHTYKICVSKDDSIRTKLWITERSVKDFRQMYSIICEEYQDLKIFNTLEKIEEAELDEDSQFFQAIGTNPDKFIDALLELIKLHQDPEPIFFFSPFNYEEEGRELFSKGFSHNDLSQEDTSAVESETEDEFDESADDPNGCYENDGFKMFCFKRKKIRSKKSKDGSGNELGDTTGHNMSAVPCSSEDHAPPTLEKEDTAHHMIGWKKPGFKAIQRYTTKFSTDPVSISTAVPRERKEENNTQRKKLEDMLLDALYHLADEVFAGGKYICRFLQSIGFLNEKSKDILAGIPKLYADDQIVWYLNQTSELLLADVSPLPVPPHKLPAMAQELLKSKLQSLLTNKCFKYFIEREILKSIKEFHEAFQNPESNKETLFRILEDLTRIVTNGSHETGSY